MSSTAHIHRVSSAEALPLLIQAIDDAERIALDTEFHAERRYHPELMLLQIATDAQTAWVVDPLAVDVRALAPALARAAVMVHGGQNDLLILDLDVGVRPRKIFDTQIGAGLLGMHYPDRLSRLGAALLDWEMDKGATLSDWSARPLSEAQLRYAAEDVLSLFAITDALEARLEARGRKELAWQASSEVLLASLRPPTAEEESQDWEITRRLDEDARRALVALLAWRREQAQQRNQPPHYILPNGVLLDLARRRPTRVRELSENRRIHPSFIKHNGSSVLEALRRAPERPPPPAPPEPHHRQLARAIRLWAELVGEAEDIAPQLLMDEALALRVATGGAAVLSDWRALVRPALEDFLSGGVVVRVGKYGSKITLEANLRAVEGS